MNALAPMPETDLAKMVDRARHLLSTGDVQAAKLLASVAYDKAQGAVKFGKRAKAGRELIGKARRMQGDALLIEAMAKIELARAWEEASTGGAAIPQGRPRKDDHRFTAEQAGLSRHLIHEGRKLREAEAREAGCIQRFIQARVDAGVEPSRRVLGIAFGRSAGDAALHRLINGRDVKALRVFELTAIGARLAADLRLVDAIKQHAGAAAPLVRIGDILSDHLLSEFIKRAAE